MNAHPGKSRMVRDRNKPLGDTTTPQTNKANAIYPAGKKMCLSTAFPIIDNIYQTYFKHQDYSQFLKKSNL